MKKQDKNNIITLTRGDYAEFMFEVNLGTNFNPVYPEISTDDIAFYFGVMENNQPFEFALIRKKLTLDNYDTEKHLLKVILNSSDTELVMPGNYHYSVKLLMGDKVFTIIDDKKFVII